MPLEYQSFKSNVAWLLFPSAVSMGSYRDGMNAPHLNHLKPVFSINSVSLESRQLPTQGDAISCASAGLAHAKRASCVLAGMGGVYWDQQMGRRTCSEGKVLPRFMQAVTRSERYCMWHITMDTLKVFLVPYSTIWTELHAVKMFLARRSRIKYCLY